VAIDEGHRPDVELAVNGNGNGAHDVELDDADLDDVDLDDVDLDDVGLDDAGDDADADADADAVDDDRFGRRLRPYALTGGRTRPAVDLPLETLVVRTEGTDALRQRLALERRRIVELCESPISVAEISSHLGVHLGVARVLVGDMKAEGLLTVYRPRPADERPDVALLQRILDGLQAL